MKRNLSLVKLAALAGLLSTLNSQPSTLFAQGTAFSVQGRLNINGTPATGIYDIRLTIYDSSSGPTVIGSPLTNSAIGVTNGIFAVTPDFGANVFTGPARWLDMAARTNGSSTFSSLGPRQPVLATPHSIFAGTASNVVSGTVVKSLNGLKDNVTLSPGNNVTFTTNGNTLTINSAGSGGGNSIWSLNGTTAYYADNVRVGYANSPDNAKFTISTPYGPFDDEPYGLEHTDGSVRLATYLDGNTAWIGTLSSHPLNFYAGGYPGGSAPMTLAPGGYLGLGITPQAKLHVNGNLRAEGSATIGGATTINGAVTINNVNGIALNAGDNPLISRGWDPFGSGAGNRVGHGRWGLFMENASLCSGIPDQSVGYRQFEVARYRVDGTRDSLLTVGNNGITTVKVLTITGGADIAEPFEMADAQGSSGSVVVIDDEHPGRLKLSAVANDTRVAGIISGANGINPGIALHQQGRIEGSQNVALTGRVYVQADAHYGAIKPGDLLTTSDTPGHAMKVTDHAKAQGAILGKAMSALGDGKGMVLVLVTLQ